jgi:hypothetical protein
MFTAAQDAATAMTVAAAVAAAAATDSCLMSKENERTVRVNHSLPSHLSCKTFCSVQSVFFIA